MRFSKALFISILFIIALYSSLYGNLSVSNKTLFEGRDETQTDGSRASTGDITFITNTMITNYSTGEDAQSIIIDGDSIISPTGSSITTFKYVAPIEETTTHPFRYTEVSFLIAFPFIYTYSVFLVAGFDMLDNILLSSGTAYTQLTTSSLIFTFAAAIFASAAIAYDNYSHVYGKKAREASVSVSFIPTIESVDKKTSAGFAFVFSYPW